MFCLQTLFYQQVKKNALQTKRQFIIIPSSEMEKNISKKCAHIFLKKFVRTNKFFNFFSKDFFFLHLKKLFLIFFFQNKIFFFYKITVNACFILRENDPFFPGMWGSMKIFLHSVKRTRNSPNLSEKSDISVDNIIREQ